MTMNPYLRNVPQQARSTERLHRIYDATGRVLADGGIEALSITAVATEAGIPPASVYDYVADSRALLAAFVTQRFDDSGHEMAEVLVPAATLDEALANVRKVFRVYFDLMRRDRGFRIAIAASQADDELVRISFEDSQRNAGHLRAMLVPFLGAESEQEVLDRCLLAVHLSGAAARMLLMIDDADIDRLIATYIDVFVANIASG
ncbi:MAG: TetR/AcrR family transcriptional regulator [Acidimicrobiales bacterium]